MQLLLSPLSSSPPHSASQGPPTETKESLPNDFRVYQSNPTPVAEPSSYWPPKFTVEHTKSKANCSIKHGWHHMQGTWHRRGEGRILTRLPREASATLRTCLVQSSDKGARWQRLASSPVAVPVSSVVFQSTQQSPDCLGRACLGQPFCGQRKPTHLVMLSCQISIILLLPKYQFHRRSTSK